MKIVPMNPNFPLSFIPVFKMIYLSYLSTVYESSSSGGLEYDDSTLEIYVKTSVSCAVPVL